MKRYGPGPSCSPCCGICKPTSSPLSSFVARGLCAPALGSKLSSWLLLLCALASAVLVSSAACAAVAAVSPFTPMNVTVCCSGLGLGATLPATFPVQWQGFEFDSSLGYHVEGGGGRLTVVHRCPLRRAGRRRQRRARRAAVLWIPGARAGDARRARIVSHTSRTHFKPRPIPPTWRVRAADL